MRTVFLTTGPRGAGKSSYCKKVIERHPGVEIVSRDDILIATYGSTMLSPYEGGHEHVREICLNQTREHLSSNESNSYLIFDYWNGYQRERQSLVKLLRQYGADRIIAWQFVTSLELCVRWFMQKPEHADCEQQWMADFRRDNCKRDFLLYHEKATDIESDGFDQIVAINPCQLIIPELPFV